MGFKKVYFLRFQIVIFKNAVLKLFMFCNMINLKSLLLFTKSQF
jgi:hypothetical protein